ncbi:hypothetical protein [Olleya sp. Bg11-27]|uniref:hypothetical protein n=1 Tax=Olleya sp. Bg11-27 TaxID=2058135 RepID=UPI000C31101A|nr:hypothetical protein [Olleya sp. Bg11-27]AUC76068.1 hypothetical protein CW732_10505 [Olleya sp. Bg11-27]
MDWRFNTIWFEQINSDLFTKWDFKEKTKENLNIENIEYAILWYFKHKGVSFDLLPESDKLLYLEMNWANFKDLNGIEKYRNLKRLELHYCTKLENDSGISSLKNTLEILHINQSKKFEPTSELYELEKLKVLRLNSCGKLKNLDFLKHFPNLIDFRFTNTIVENGDLKPILEHPSIRSVGFMNKRHYNYKDIEIAKELNLKSPTEFKDFVYKGEYSTFKYKKTIANRVDGSD